MFSESTRLLNTGPLKYVGNESFPSQHIQIPSHTPNLALSCIVCIGRELTILKWKWLVQQCPTRQPTLPHTHIQYTHTPSSDTHKSTKSKIPRNIYYDTQQTIKRDFK